MGFEEVYPVTGQTAPRKLDAQALRFLSSVSESSHRFANDVRLLMGLGCVEEPWQESQIGSSAMAYKRNPMRSERMTSLARLAMVLAAVPAHTAAEQWFERTLDDSAGRRIAVPEAFLAVDAILVLYENVARGLTVFPAALRRELVRELPAMATEEILMRCVAAGGDRQELHELIRRHAHAAARRVKEEGVENDLLARLAGDPAFAAVRDDFDALLEPERFLGRSPEQVDEFLEDVVAPVLERHRDALEARPAGDVRV
jgi:adenylosuccinate lyase